MLPINLTKALDFKAFDLIYLSKDANLRHELEKHYELIEGSEPWQVFMRIFDYFCVFRNIFSVQEIIHDLHMAFSLALLD